MNLPRRLLVRGVLPLAVAALAACAATVPTAPPVSRPTLTPATIVAAVHAAGDQEKSVIAVKPLADPGIAAWQATAEKDVHTGKYDAAAVQLDQALGRSPDSPELLQDRAEVAIWQHDYPLAEKLAQRSWSLGPKLGPLCARNWETIAQLRKSAGDDTGVATAEKWVAKCHVQGVNRF
ncbi:MAG: tetratricopeptide repeat protein [Rhodanobacter sp.]|nr:MAG: tetratricopeptide repeat protein [Rhodanobacter sp.]TAM13496.1 MAG: tetratricopeptide repeat protein [Rhodanobacter sp.]TAM35751.1 MAG: tetratricopeptide repeat protein [Rhodanobacter sp.]